MKHINNLSAILAIEKNNGIGLNNKMPWHYPDDLQWFKQNTLAKTLIMGRKTFLSILKHNNNKLLEGRKFIVLTSSKEPIENVKTFNKFFDIIEEVKSNPKTDYMIVGGAQLYNLSFPLINRLYLTKIDKEIHCDTFADLSLYEFEKAQRFYYFKKNDLSFYIYQKI